MKLVYTYFWKTLPVGDLIWLALIWLAFSKSSQIVQPTSYHLKARRVYKPPQWHGWGCKIFHFVAEIKPNTFTVNAEYLLCFALFSRRQENKILQWFNRPPKWHRWGCLCTCFGQDWTPEASSPENQTSLCPEMSCFVTSQISPLVTFTLFWLRYAKWFSESLSNSESEKNVTYQPTPEMLVLCDTSQFCGALECAVEFR